MNSYLDSIVAETHLSTDVKFCLELLLEFMNNLCIEITDIALDWDKLNKCWLKVLDYPDTITQSDWQAVRDALEASCNILELYGLVDYEYGIIEEPIMEKISMKC